MVAELVVTSLANEPQDVGRREPSMRARKAFGVVPYHRRKARSNVPGCTSERRKSPDGCTRELEITCERSTCLETIVFSEDLSKYTGSVVCTGTYSGVDEDGTFECRTIVDGARNP